VTKLSHWSDMVAVCDGRAKRTEAHLPGIAALWRSIADQYRCQEPVERGLRGERTREIFDGPSLFIEGRGPEPMEGGPVIEAPFFTDPTSSRSCSSRSERRQRTRGRRKS